MRRAPAMIRAGARDADHTIAIARVCCSLEEALEHARALRRPGVIATWIVRFGSPAYRLRGRRR